MLLAWCCEEWVVGLGESPELVIEARRQQCKCGIMRTWAAVLRKARKERGGITN